VFGLPVVHGGRQCFNGDPPPQANKRIGMNVHYLQHVPFEGLGSIESWVSEKGHNLTSTRLYAGDPLPAPDRFDLLVIMGGPMSIHDEAEYVWLKAEKWFIKQAIDAGKPVLGICLGAQLIAEGLGAEVYPGKEKEIGWFPITLTKEFSATELGKCLPETMEVFHWHGETFSLPPGAQRIASSTACNNQGFIVDGRVIGLQFHLETTSLSAQSLIDHSRDELIAGPYIQSESVMLENAERFSKNNRLMQVILTYLEALAVV
jgi:GMP synthase-like glutamine amidotransferase